MLATCILTELLLEQLFVSLQKIAGTCEHKQLLAEHRSTVSSMLAYVSPIVSLASCVHT